MATKNTPILQDELTVASPAQAKKDTVPRVRVFLPVLEDTADVSAIEMDQYEHVTVDGVTTLIKRGEYVDVTVPVFIQLRNKFPHI